MATINEVSNQIRSKIYGLGRAAVNALFPNDCEFYMVALELVDSKDRTVDFLTFPVMPSQIQESKPEKTTVMETAGGVVVITSPTFKPRDISISGNFGRDFSMNIAGLASFVALRYSTMSGVYHKEDMHPQNMVARAANAALPPVIKTGYGFMKVLEAMIDKAAGVDELGLPMRLYFYNPAFGNNYVVEPMSTEFKQAKSDSNMIWNYSINMKATAPLSLVRGALANRIVTALSASFSVVNSKVLKLAGDIKV